MKVLYQDQEIYSSRLEIATENNSILTEGGHTLHDNSVITITIKVPAGFYIEQLILGHNNERK